VVLSLPPGFRSRAAVNIRKCKPFGASQQATLRLSFLTIMADLCAYPPCKCLAPDDEIFCGEACAMLGAGLVNQVRTSFGAAAEV
jgi:hypothetical protein